MKYLIVILGLLIVSCGTVNRNIQKTATVENTHSTITDLSEIETTRKFDTTVHTKLEVATSSLSLQEIDSCKDSLITKETKSGNLTLKTTYNKNSKEFTAEAKKDAEDLHVSVDETIKQKNNVVTDNNKKSEVATTTKHVEKESSFNPTKIAIWIGAIIGIVLLILGIIKLPNWKK